MELGSTARNSGGFISPRKLLLSVDLQNIHKGELEIPSRAVGLGERLGTAIGFRETWQNQGLFIRQAFGMRDWEEPETWISAMIQRKNSWKGICRRKERQGCSACLQRALDGAPRTAGTGTCVLSVPEPWVQLRAGITNTPAVLLIAPVTSKGASSMTSLSRPISSDLHNDSADLNSPQSFGSLRGSVLPALLCWATLPLRGLSPVLGKDILPSRCHSLDDKVCPERGGELVAHSDRSTSSRQPACCFSRHSPA